MHKTVLCDYQIPYQTKIYRRLEGKLDPPGALCLACRRGRDEG